MKLLQTWLANCLQLSRRVDFFLYLILFKTILALYSGLSSSPSFFVFKIIDHFTTEKFGFFHFLSVISTDKPVSGSKHAYALTQLKVFAFRGFFLSCYSQETRKEFEQIEQQNTNDIWRENVLADAHFWRGSAEIEYQSHKMAQQL